MSRHQKKKNPEVNEVTPGKVGIEPKAGKIHQYQVIPLITK